MFKDATCTFGDIAVKPTGDDMYCMNKTLPPILLKTPHNQVDATHNLSGLITPSAKYATKYGTDFKHPTRPKPYCPPITAAMSNANQCKAGATHSACKEDYQLY